MDRRFQDQIDKALPGEMARYVRLDTAAWVRDAQLNGDIAIVQKPSGGVWIFDSRQ